MLVDIGQRSWKGIQHRQREDLSVINPNNSVASVLQSVVMNSYCGLLCYGTA